MEVKSLSGIRLLQTVSLQYERNKFDCDELQYCGKSMRFEEGTSSTGKLINKTNYKNYCITN